MIIYTDVGYQGLGPTPAIVDFATPWNQKKKEEYHHRVEE